jgi:hypothetical protein
MPHFLNAFTKPSSMSESGGTAELSQAQVLCFQNGRCNGSESVQDFAFPRMGLCSSLEFDQEFGFPELVFRGSKSSPSLSSHWSMLSLSESSQQVGSLPQSQLSRASKLSSFLLGLDFFSPSMISLKSVEVLS